MSPRLNKAKKMNSKGGEQVFSNLDMLKQERAAAQGGAFGLGLGGVQTNPALRYLSDNTEEENSELERLRRENNALKQ